MLGSVQRGEGQYTANDVNPPPLTGKAPLPEIISHIVHSQVDHIEQNLQDRVSLIQTKSIPYQLIKEKIKQLQQKLTDQFLDNHLQDCQEVDGLNINQENYLDLAYTYAQLKNESNQSQSVTTTSAVQLKALAEVCIHHFVKKYRWSFTYYHLDLGLPRIRVEKNGWNPSSFKDLLILIQCGLIEGLVFSADFFTTYIPESMNDVLKHLKILMLEKIVYEEKLFNSLAQNCTQLQSLILCHHLDDPNYVFPFAKYAKSLTHIAFMFGYFRDIQKINVHSLINLLKEYPSICSLTINNACSFTYEHFNQLASACVNLTHLYLNNVNLKAGSVQLFLHHCKKLQVLTLAWCDGLMELTIDYLIGYLNEKNCQLKKLNIEGNQNFEFIKKCQKLAKLQPLLDFSFKI